MTPELPIAEASARAGGEVVARYFRDFANVASEAKAGEPSYNRVSVAFRRCCRWSSQALGNCYSVASTCHWALHCGRLLVGDSVGLDHPFVFRLRNASLNSTAFAELPRMVCCTHANTSRVRRNFDSQLLSRTANDARRCRTPRLDSTVVERSTGQIRIAHQSGGHQRIVGWRPRTKCRTVVVNSWFANPAHRTRDHGHRRNLHSTKSHASRPNRRCTPLGHRFVSQVRFPRDLELPTSCQRQQVRPHSPGEQLNGIICSRPR